MAKTYTIKGRDQGSKAPVDLNAINAELDAIANARGIVWGRAELSPSDSGQSNSARTRYATPGQRTGNGIVRHVSQAQVNFMVKLFRERDTTTLVLLPGSEDIRSMSLAGARDLIDRLLALPMKPGQASVRMATEGQARYLGSLLAQRVTPADVDAERAPASYTFEAASSLIERLKAAPAKPAPVSEEIESGVYHVNGEIFKVKRAVHGSGNMYASRLNRATGKFEYAPGAVRNIRAEHRMTLVQAKEFGAVYGVCCNCGRTLTDEKSIEAAIGPVCAKRFA